MGDVTARTERAAFWRGWIIGNLVGVVVLGLLILYAPVLGLPCPCAINCRSEMKVSALPRPSEHDAGKQQVDTPTATARP